MRTPYRVIVALMALCLGALSIPGLAAGTTLSTQCVMGQPGPMAGTGTLGLETTFCTLINPATCPCNSGPALLTMVHVQLDSNAGFACQIGARVEIVGATGDPACLTPDMLNVLCPRVDVLLDAQGAGGLVTHDIPLPAGCCIQGPAFLFVDMQNVTCAEGGGPDVGSMYLTDVFLPYDGSCDPCVSWNMFPASPSTWTAYEMCSQGSLGNPMVWVDADCCPPTPTQRRSWGAVKTLYR